jgi:hypothetical protein
MNDGPRIGLEAEEGLPLAQLLPLLFLTIGSLFSPRLPSLLGCRLTRPLYRRPFYLPKFKLGDNFVRLLYEGCTSRVSLTAALDSANVSRQFAVPCAPCAPPPPVVHEEPAAAPAWQECCRCHRWLPLIAFVGPTGRQTTVCRNCWVCILEIALGHCSLLLSTLLTLLARTACLPLQVPLPLSESCSPPRSRRWRRISCLLPTRRRQSPKYQKLRQPMMKVYVNAINAVDGGL